MATAEELLSQVSDEQVTSGETKSYLTVDLITRQISIPSDVKNLGVESDDEVTRLYFRVPRYIGDVDLSTFQVRINYLNADNRGDIYYADDITVGDDGYIYFSWLVGRFAVTKHGNVTFVVCMIEPRTDGTDIIDREFNTAIATLPVLKGLETSTAVYEEERDVLASVAKVAASEALADAHASGAFKGDPGDPGYTPQRGVDYWTQEDKEEILADVGEIATEGLIEEADLPPEFFLKTEQANIETVASTGSTLVMKYRSGVISTVPNTDYKITVKGEHNRFFIAGSIEETLVAGGSAPIIWNSDNTTARSYDETIIINSGEYRKLIVTIGSTANGSGTSTVEYIEGYTDPDVISFGTFDLYSAKKVEQVIHEAGYVTKEDLPAELLLKPQTLDIQSVSATISEGVIFKYYGVIIPSTPNTDYKVTIKGSHDRFVISGTTDETIVSGSPVTVLYNSGNSTDRNYDEYFVVNSGGNNNLIVNVAYQSDVTNTVVEYIEGYTDPDVISFGTFDLYSAKKVDEMLIASSSVGSMVYMTGRNVENVASTEEVYALYDGLVESYPNYITKNELTVEGSDFVNYEYVFSSGNYNTLDTPRGEDQVMEKPVILIISGIHGEERSAVMSTYQFFRDMANYLPILYSLRESVTFKVIPVANPYGFSTNTRYNANGVNINCNFNTDLWESVTKTEKGDAPADQIETQLLQTWMDANPSAYLLVDHHNSGYDNEISMIGGDNSKDNISKIKKRYLQGVDRVVPYWRDSEILSDTTVVDGEVVPTTYAYTGGTDGKALSIGYSQNKVGITSICIETAISPNGMGWNTVNGIAVGAEAFGNMLLGIFDGMLRDLY